MTPAQFITKWGDSRLRERQGSQEHFIDLCRLLGQPTPAEDDPLGERYCFERGAEKVGGGDGWADVWRKGCFGWEYKGKHKDLNGALRQLQAYALDLQNPPYLVVSDMERVIVHTNWTNTVSRRYEFKLDDLHEPHTLDILRQVFEGSDRLKPGISPQELTAKVAARFGELGRRLQERGHHPREVAHFLNRLVFCMFAEDAKLLPDGLFTKVVRATQTRPDHARSQLAELFAKMRTGGFFGADVIKWFNGGLFDDAEVLPLESIDLKLVGDTAHEHDWSQIDPAIFGTLFEQALKATRERPALGAHYTDREKILKIVDPVIVRPLTAEWDDARRAIKAAMDDVSAADEARKAVMERAAEAMRADPGAAKAGEAARRKELSGIAKARDAAYGRAQDLLDGFRFRLSQFRVLDPACGSGNFLYVALHALRDIELRAQMDAERLGLPQRTPLVGLECVRGIEIEAYAAELARVTLWIGDLQWLRKNGYTGWNEPILSSLDQIENRDALLNGDGTEAQWPAVDVIIGNPPFLGDKKMVADIGEEQVAILRSAYSGRVPGGADFVCYWIEKAWDEIGNSRAKRAGFVTTNSIRGGANRRVVQPIADDAAIWEAWADEPWALDGAAVRVSMLGYGKGFVDRRLEGRIVDQINVDLSGTVIDLVSAAPLISNSGISFIGTQKNGPFDIPGALARLWLTAPRNPNGLPNSAVLFPWMNGQHLTRRPEDMWVIYFPPSLAEPDASLFEKPFEQVTKFVAPMRTHVRRDNHRLKWWIHGEARPGMFKALKGLQRFIATPRVAKHRVFGWLDSRIIPDCQLVVIARDDDTSFGILHSRFHELWSLRMGTWLGVGNDPRYTPSTTFETFPFPEGLTPNIPAADYAHDPRAQAIAAAAAELNRLREAWLNPADLVRIEPEVVPGYPDRILPKDEAAAAVLKKRTLTNLYNDRPAWLDMAHRRLDDAVAAAYGWPTDLTDEQVLERLFALNQERAAAGR
jgi:type II restriction/modification system DNA methylase subunit YeeA